MRNSRSTLNSRLSAKSQGQMMARSDSYASNFSFCFRAVESVEVYWTKVQYTSAIVMVYRPIKFSWARAARDKKWKREKHDEVLSVVEGLGRSLSTACQARKIVGL